MSNRVFGIFPRSGEKMLKDAIGQFKGIISQIKEGVKKVKIRVAKNADKTAKIEADAAKQTSKLDIDTEKLTSAMNEATIVLNNLEAMLKGEITTIQVDNSVAEDETVDDKSGDTTSEESGN